MKHPSVVVVAGARGTGKSGWMMQQAAGDDRMFLWDFKGDPRLRGTGDRYTELQPALAAMQAPKFRIHYVVNQFADVAQQFDLVCQAAFRIGKLRLVVMELPQVTSSRKPPDTWLRLVNVSREYEDRRTGATLWVSLMVEAQRLEEVDMSIRGNADVIHVGRLGNVSDCEKFARMWGIKVAELSMLPNLHWIEHRHSRPGVTRGVLTFAGSPRKKQLQQPLPEKKVVAPVKPPKEAPLGK